jgi:phosphate transport system permease protein
MRTLIERAFRCSSIGAGVVLVGVIGLFIGFLLVKGVTTLGPALLFGDIPALEALTGRSRVWDGIFPALVGTLCVVVLANAIALPLGIASGIFLSEYLHGAARRRVCLLVDIFAGIPSIIMGLFGFAMILFLRATWFPHANTSLILAACCLGFLIMPYIIATTRSSLENLPANYRLIGPSLGLSQSQNIRHVLLPACRRPLLGGAVLAIGRSAEDTAVIMLTGVVASAGLPNALTGKFEALPFFIFYYTAEYRSPQDIERAFGAAILLMLISTTLFFLAHHGASRQEARELSR